MIVYKIINKINGKCYIGQTTNSLNRRWNQHCNDKKGYCRILSNAILKYGKENFEIKILCRCDTMEELNHREEYFIKLFNTLSPNGYNLTSGGKNRLHSKESKEKMSNSRKGNKNVMYGKTHTESARKKIGDAQTGNKHWLNKTHTEESKKKISDSRKGKPLSEKTKRALSLALSNEKNPMFGKTHTEEAKKKMSNSRKGKKNGEDNPFFGRSHSEESRKKISIANKGRPSFRKGKTFDRAAKKVLLIELNKAFRSVREAIKFCVENDKSTTHASIRKSTKNPNRTAAGFHWRFL